MTTAITNANFNTAIAAWLGGDTTTYGAITDWNTSAVTSMKEAFRSGVSYNGVTTNFNEDLSGWITSAVTDMTSMFEGASSFNKELKADVGGKWDVSSVTDMTNMFKGATDFNQIIRNWSVGRATTLTNMFLGSHSNMTNGTHGFSSSYITSGTPVYQYFSLTKAELLSAIGDWFPEGATISQGNMSDWNVSAITNLGQIFGWPTVDGDKYFSASLPANEDISNWDTGECTDMNHMFIHNSKFNWDIGRWDVSKNVNFHYMLFSASDFNQDVKNWNVDNATNLNYVFGNTSMPTSFGNANDDGPLLAAAKSYFVLPLTNANINDAIDEFISPTGDTNITTLGGTVPTNNPQTKYGFLKDWDVSSITDMSGLFLNKTFTTPFNHDLSSWETHNVTTMSNMFKGHTSYNKPMTTDNNKWNVASVINMNSMFNGCDAFNADISSWNTTSVINMSNMFDGCSTFNQNLSTNGNEWNTTAVTNMSSMFNDASGFNQDISSWNLGAVTSIAGMFKGASTFNNASTSMENWLATPNASLDNLTELFSGATAFNVALTNWDTSKITNMSDMFKNADAFNQDISTWDMSSVTNTTGMFADEAASVAAAKEADDAVSKTTAAVANLVPADKTAIIAIAQELDDKKVELMSAIGTFTDTGITGYTATERRSINTDQGTALSGIKALFDPAAVGADARALQRKTVIANLKTALNLIISSAGVNSIEIDASQLVLSGTYDSTDKIIVAKANTTVRDPVGEPPSNFYSTLSNDGDWVERKYNAGVIPGELNSFTIKILRNDVGAEERYELSIVGNSTTWAKLGIIPDPNGVPWLGTFDATDGNGYLLVGDKVMLSGTTDYVYIIIGSAESSSSGNTICFLGDTRVKTDQGLIRFDTLTLDNTINNYKIKRITKVKNADDHMIFIEKDALGENIPNKDTYISRNHGIIVGNHLVRAKTLVNGNTIKKAYRKRDIIYNVLTEVYSIIYVNNMPCETLNPNDPIVQRYI